MSDIHIMTSVKGGVGKTLISLGIICSYLTRKEFKGRHLLAVDLNLMNTDLYRILRDPEGGFNSILGGRWWEVVGEDGRHIVRRNAAHELPNGAAGFWNQLREIVEYEDFAGNDFLVDTNLHAGNMFTSKLGSSEEPIIDGLLRRDSKLYIWIIWTWHALNDSQEMNAAIARIPNAIRDRVTVVHVLNPSAIVPPHINASDTLEVLTGLRKVEAGVDAAMEEFAVISERIEHAQPALHDPEISLFLEEARRRMEQQAKQIAVAPIKLEPYVFTGLSALAYTGKIGLSMPYTEIVPLLGNYFEDRLREAARKREQEPGTARPFDDDYEELNKLFQKSHGRPQNLLVISTYDPNLVGYTDRVAFQGVSQLHLIWDALKSIREEIGIFLEDLALIAGDEV